MAYTKINWEDLPSTETPINKINLRHMDDGIENANNTKVVNTTNTNLNDYTETGTYYFSSSYTPTNIPVGVNGWLHVIKGVSEVKQIWYRQGTINSNDYQTYIRSRSNAGEWGNWKRLMVEDDFFFKKGETYSTVSRVTCPAFLSSSQRGIYFTLPLPKKTNNITSITVNSFTINARKVSGGYLLNGITKQTFNGSIKVQYIEENSVKFYLEQNTAFSETNNTPVGLEIEISITFN